MDRSVVQRVQLQPWMMVSVVKLILSHFCTPMRSHGDTISSQSRVWWQISGLAACNSYQMHSLRHTIFEFHKMLTMILLLYRVGAIEIASIVSGAQV